MRRRKRGDDNADVNAEASGGKRLSEMNMATELYFDDGAGDTVVQGLVAHKWVDVAVLKGVDVHTVGFDILA